MDRMMSRDRNRNSNRLDDSTDGGRDGTSSASTEELTEPWMAPAPTFSLASLIRMAVSDRWLVKHTAFDPDGVTFLMEDTQSGKRYMVRAEEIGSGPEKRSRG